MKARMIMVEAEGDAASAAATAVANFIQRGQAMQREVDAFLASPSKPINLHDDEATLTAERAETGDVTISVNMKRAVRLVDGERCYYGASITLSPRQVEALRKFLAKAGRTTTRG
jgi:hypothetical protein